MKTISKNIKLTEKDKKTITKNSNICTDMHGKSCDTINPNEKNKSLN